MRRSEKNDVCGDRVAAVAPVETTDHRIDPGGFSGTLGYRLGVL